MATSTSRIQKIERNGATTRTQGPSSTVAMQRLVSPRTEDFLASTMSQASVSSPLLKENRDADWFLAIFPYLLKNLKTTGSIVADGLKDYIDNGYLPRQEQELITINESIEEWYIQLRKIIYDYITGNRKPSRAEVIEQFMIKLRFQIVSHLSKAEHSQISSVLDDHPILTTWLQIVFAYHPGIEATAESEQSQAILFGDEESQWAEQALTFIQSFSDYGAVAAVIDKSRSDTYDTQKVIRRDPAEQFSKFVGPTNDIVSLLQKKIELAPTFEELIRIETKTPSTLAEYINGMVKTTAAIEATIRFTSEALSVPSIIPEKATYIPSVIALAIYIHERSQDTNDLYSIWKEDGKFASKFKLGAYVHKSEYQDMSKKIKALI